MKAHQRKDGVCLEPCQTVWHCFCGVGPALDNPSFVSKFRCRLRMPFEECKTLLEKAKEELSLTKWQRRIARVSKAFPMELLLSGSLRYSGSGLTLNDLEECTAKREQPHRELFHCFIRCGQDSLFQHVIHPTNACSTHNELCLGALTPGVTLRLSKHMAKSLKWV